MSFFPGVLSRAALFSIFLSLVHASILSPRQSSTAGDSQCFSSMCVSATVNGSNVDYVLTSTGSTVGWMGVGWGTQMVGSDVVILWDNSDGSITLSQRHASEHAEPAVVASPSAKATLVQSLSTTSGSTRSYAFSMPSTSSGKVNMIYAFSGDKPSSPAVDARLVQHDTMGTFNLDLSSSTTVPIPGQIPSNPSSANSNRNQPLSKSEKMIVAHAILVTIGYLFLLPMGVLVARLFRTFTNHWFPIHITIQWFIAGSIIVVGFALGVAAHQSRGGGPLDNHMKWGIVLFCLYVLQIGVGSFIHWVKPNLPRRRPPQNYFHAVFGLLILGLAFYQVYDGITHQWPRITGRPEPTGARIVWYVWVVLICVMYIAGLAFIPKQYRQERDFRHAHGVGKHLQ